jgi:hypothetical protein
MVKTATASTDGNVLRPVAIFHGILTPLTVKCAAHLNRFEQSESFFHLWQNIPEQNRVGWPHRKNVLFSHTQKELEECLGGKWSVGKPRVRREGAV